MLNLLWYKDAVFYEVHVKSFYDSNGDGIGDFAGLTQKMDYLENLGVDCIWLQPFYLSPLRDDGYDIADYFAVRRGTLAARHDNVRCPPSSVAWRAIRVSEVVDNGPREPLAGPLRASP